mmetsp:Transcript_113170/g.320314  ORF Transcript_113170/g.320314 Transcript_113170/m.320314 type:complete len:156 (+) Transcript_113170:747-1214(+)
MTDDYAAMEEVERPSTCLFERDALVDAFLREACQVDMKVGHRLKYADGGVEQHAPTGRHDGHAGECFPGASAHRVPAHAYPLRVEANHIKPESAGVPEPLRRGPSRYARALSRVSLRYRRRRSRERSRTHPRAYTRNVRTRWQRTHPTHRASYSK